MSVFDDWAQELEFIEKHHVEVAAMAWDGYLRSGRGALFFRFDHDASLRTRSVNYVSKPSTWIAKSAALVGCG